MRKRKKPQQNPVSDAYRAGWEYAGHLEEPLNMPSDRVCEDGIPGGLDFDKYEYTSISVSLRRPKEQP